MGRVQIYTSYLKSKFCEMIGNIIIHVRKYIMIFNIIILIHYNISISII
jgi:hypothetical protein